MSTLLNYKGVTYYNSSSWPQADCGMISPGDTAWMLISTGLVLLMTPGIAILFGGLVHKRSVLTIMMQVASSISVLVSDL